MSYDRDPETKTTPEYVIIVVFLAALLAVFFFS